MSEEISYDLKIGSKLIGKYEIEALIGKGSFGKIYLATELKTKKKFAIKIEILEKHSNKSETLENELHIIKLLENEQGFPLIYDYYKTEYLGILIMNLLGKNLESFLKKHDGSFSLKSVLLIAVQLLNRIEIIHLKGIIHRDLKPENFLMGLNNKKNVVNIIDFGLSKIYCDENGHIPFREKKGFVGTTRYASIGAHLGKELSRRDDLESLGYIIIYFLKGKLPWTNLNEKT